MTVHMDHADIVKTKCRHCNAPLTKIFVDLGAMPVSNDFIKEENRNGPENYYPLRTYICDSCRLLQLEDFRKANDLFREDYAYFSSISTSWLTHAKKYAEMMSSRFNLNSSNTVIEIASNDGYLLQFFKEKGINILGIEPCRSVAEFAINKKSIPTRIEFFGEKLGKDLAAEGNSADLTIANNVLAHVPNINDFVSGFREILKPEGIATFEFPHLLNLIKLNQFDTIYHEHFSYISLIAAKNIFASNGLRIFDVETIPTHGGSLRLFVCRPEASWTTTDRVDNILHQEYEEGLGDDEVYFNFAKKTREVKNSLLELLISLKRRGNIIVGYGAPAKGNTLLNYCGIGPDFLEFTVDRSPQKQGLYLPGTRLPIKSPEAIKDVKPDYVLILPWNIKDEIIDEMEFIREWGGKFIVPIPQAHII